MYLSIVSRRKHPPVVDVNHQAPNIIAFQPTSISAHKLHAFFDRVAVINLRHRPDRLTTFRQELEQKNWPFVEPDVFEAVWGDRLPVPKEFTQGGGALGCRQSHVAILQRALRIRADSIPQFPLG